MIYRIEPTLARQQAQWFVLGLVLFARRSCSCATTACSSATATRSPRVGIGLLLLPRAAGHRRAGQRRLPRRSTSARSRSSRPSSRRSAIVIFLASYLRDTRQLLVSARGACRHDDPAAQALRPAARGLGPAMLMLIVIRDLGSSLMFFGGFLALLYVATGRLSFVVVGLALFVARRVVLRDHVGHVHDRVDVWLHPFDPRSTTRSAAATSSPSRCSPRPTAACSGRASARRCSTCPAAGRSCPPPHTDLIYAVITNELGLFGAGAVLLDLPAVRRSAASRRRCSRATLLEAARGRADGGVRAAGVRDRRRRHARDPADRRDAARSSPTAARRSSRTSCCSRCCCSSPTARGGEARWR